MLTTAINRFLKFASVQSSDTLVMDPQARTKTLLFMAAFALASIVFAGCGSTAGEPNAEGEVVVYVAVPLSGFQANGGQTILGGVRLAAEEINRSGGLLGKTVVVRPLDDESDSDTAVSQVAQIDNALSNGDEVIGIIGHLNSGQTQAAMEHLSRPTAHRHHADCLRTGADRKRLYQLLPRECK